MGISTKQDSNGVTTHIVTGCGPERTEVRHWIVDRGTEVVCQRVEVQIGDWTNHTHIGATSDPLAWALWLLADRTRGLTRNANVTTDVAAEVAVLAGHRTTPAPPGAAADEEA